jgi:hypothetical protein
VLAWSARSAGRFTRRGLRGSRRCRSFEPPPPRPQTAKRRRRRRTDEPWQRPETFIPGYLDENFVLARSDQVAVVVQGIACYPTGFTLELHTVTRYEIDPEDLVEHDMAIWSHPRRRRDVPAG